MGGTSSKNQVNVAVNESIAVINETTQDCRTFLSQDQTIDLQSCGGDIIISGVTLSQYNQLDSTCVQSAETQNDIEAEIETIMDQSAKAISSNLQLGSTEAENIGNLMEDLGVEVKNSFYQQCLTEGIQSQTLSANSCDGLNEAGGNIVVTDVEFSQVQKGISNCIQDSTAVNKIKTDIFNEIDQDASAASIPALVWIIIVLIGFMLIIFIAVAALRVVKKPKQTQMQT